MTIINDGQIICEHDAKKHLDNLYALLYPKKVARGKKHFGWSTKEEEALLAIVARFGTYDTGRLRQGVITTAAEELKRNRAQITSKLQDLRARGKL